MGYSTHFLSGTFLQNRGWRAPRDKRGEKGGTNWRNWGGREKGNKGVEVPPKQLFPFTVSPLLRYRKY